MKVVGVVLDGITVDLIIVDCSIVVICCAVDIAAKFDCNRGPSIDIFIEWLSVHADQGKVFCCGICMHYRHMYMLLTIT